jgi:hypothetical protein
VTVIADNGLSGAFGSGVFLRSWRVGLELFAKRPRAADVAPGSVLHALVKKRLAVGYARLPVRPGTLPASFMQLATTRLSGDRELDGRTERYQAKRYDKNPSHLFLL